jgi:hypothetical protein
MQKNLPLIIAFLVPLAMILFIGGSIYLPTLFIHPHDKFIYSTNSPYPYDYGDHYVVTNQTLEKVSIPYPPNYIKPPTEIHVADRLFLYDASTDTSSEITLDQAKMYRLSTSEISPYGFKLEPYNGGDNIFSLFGGTSRDYGAQYLKKGVYNKKINLSRVPNDYYNYNFRFLGWVTNN